MSTFVLVHGAFHGAWCWGRVVPELQAAGHAVVARDLPGSGDDPTPAAEVTLDSYAESVVALLDAATEPVVLVGHSMGGLVITVAAERRPEKVARLVYLCANLIADGQALIDTFQLDENAQSLALAAFVASEDGLTATTTPEGWHPAYYGDCSEEDMAWVLPKLRPQPLAPLAEAISTTPERWGSIPRAYIECTQDKTLLIGTQRQMREALPCDPVITLEASHSPFLSQPAAVVDALLGLA